MFQSENPGNFSMFWDNLEKASRLRIWTSLDIDSKKSILLEPKNLKNNEKQKVWEQIGRENHRELW